MGFFGTDGIRNLSTFFTSDFLEKFAWCLTYLPDLKKVCIARDTRVSGEYILSTLCENLISLGVDVISLDVVPSPCLALACKVHNCYGVMITASHNPPEFNGLKLFGKDGGKCQDDVEQIIEKKLLSSLVIPYSRSLKKGKKQNLDGLSLYLPNNTAPNGEGKKILLDCAFGAASGFAATVFTRNGYDVFSINDDISRGNKINVNCGSEKISKLSVLSKDYDYVVSFDGDADRVHVIKDGKIFDGDKILYLLACAMKKENKLRNNAVCATIMTNMGLENALFQQGIKLYRADVGDKEVAKVIAKYNLNLGGEKSGHIIINDFLPTGDGINTALRFIESYQKIDEDIFAFFHEIPQFSHAIKTNNFGISNFINRYGKGIFRACSGVRIVVRASGTEPIIRFLVESENAELARNQMSMLIEEIGGIL